MAEAAHLNCLRSSQYSLAYVITDHNFLKGHKASSILVSQGRSLRHSKVIVKSIKEFFRVPEYDDASVRAADFIRPGRTSGNIDLKPGAIGLEGPT